MSELSIETIFDSVVESPGSVDIREHMPVLRKYASRCNRVTEFGTRWVVSTWAFMAGRPKSLTSFDIDHFSIYGVDPNILDSVSSKLGVCFKFYQEDVLKSENVFETDFLFIDTVHSYKQLKMELHLHASKVKKYIAFHDTVSFGEENEAEIDLKEDWSEELKYYYKSLPDTQGINAAIVEFLIDSPEWHVALMSNKNNGLLIIERNKDVKD